MKRILLAFIFVFMFTWIMAQNRSLAPQARYTHAEKVSNVLPAENAPVLPLNANSVVNREDSQIIGRTWYDLQSNNLLQNRIHAFDDGSVGAVWTMGLTASSFPDRGTGYNYFNGSEWGPEPTLRLESMRTGWPSYAPWGENGEVVVSHDFGAHVLYFLTRENKGTGDWTEFPYTYSSGPPELSWARMTTSGENNTTVHLLANSFAEYEGQTTATVYSRSLDGGASWDQENIIIDGMGSDYYTEIGADDYVFAEPNGGAIAFLCASAWYDMFMMKSTDDGETWEKTVIWEHPYPFFDWETTITDTFFCVDNSASIALDSQGKAHVVFGINRVLHAEAGTSYFLFPYVDGIGYWNEDMPSFSNDVSALAPPELGFETSEMITDYNYIGWTQDVNGNGVLDLVDDVMYYREFGFSTMPTISIMDNNQIVVVWASTTETYDNFDFNFKKLWARTWVPGGGWGPFQHLTEDIVYIFDETVYPVLAPRSDNGEYHLIFNADGSPGLALDEDHDYVENRIQHMVFMPETTSLEDLEKPSSLEVAVYPNPVIEYLNLSLKLETGSEISVEMVDLFGRTLKQLDMGYLPEGNHAVGISAEGLAAGALFVRVIAGQETITTRVLVSGN